MKYFNVEWTRLVKQTLKRKGVDQSWLARKMGTSTASLTQVLRRGKLTTTTVRRISIALDEDMVVHLLSDQTISLLNKARKAGLSEIPLDQIDPNLIKERLAMQQDMKSDHSQISTLKAKLDEQTRQVGELEEKLKAERSQYVLQIARLEAKLEVYQEMRANDLPPSNLA